MSRISGVSLSIVPTSNRKYIFSFTGIIRCIEIKLCFLAAVSTKFFARCYSSETIVPINGTYHDVDVLPMRLCIGPNMHAYIMFSLVTQFAFIVNLAFYILQFTNFEKDFQNVPWTYVVIFHTGSSAALILIASTIMIAGHFKNIAIYVGCGFSFCAFAVFAFHFIWEMKNLVTSCIEQRAAK